MWTTTDIVLFVFVWSLFFYSAFAGPRKDKAPRLIAGLIALIVMALAIFS